jgi:hypothetical protein
MQNTLDAQLDRGMIRAVAGDKFLDNGSQEVRSGATSEIVVYGDIRSGHGLVD